MSVTNITMSMCKNPSNRNGQLCKPIEMLSFMRKDWGGGLGVIHLVVHNGNTFIGQNLRTVPIGVIQLVMSPGRIYEQYRLE